MDVLGALERLHSLLDTFPTEDAHHPAVQVLHLVQYLAVFLAETITGLLQRVLTHPARGLVDETNAALLTQKFWVQAIYTELLCASSRHRAPCLAPAVGSIHCLYGFQHLGCP